MGETETHITQLTDFLLHPLKERYRDRQDVYVAINRFLYYKRGTRRPLLLLTPTWYSAFQKKFGGRTSCGRRAERQMLFLS